MRKLKKRPVSYPPSRISQLQPPHRSHSNRTGYTLLLGGFIRRASFLPFFGCAFAFGVCFFTSAAGFSARSAASAELAAAISFAASSAAVAMAAVAAMTASAAVMFGTAVIFALAFIVVFVFFVVIVVFVIVVIVSVINACAFDVEQRDLNHFIVYDQKQRVVRALRYETGDFFRTVAVDLYEFTLQFLQDAFEVRSCNVFRRFIIRIVRFAGVA